MKHIALITLHTPTLTNLRGASALPYHLLAFRPKDTRVEIWSYNLNCCNSKQIEATEKDLGVKIHPIGIPKWFQFTQPAPVRLFLSRPSLSYLPLPEVTTNEIKTFLSQSDSNLWIYGEDISHIAKKFPNVKTVITTPDCEAMYYHRVLGMKGIPLNKGAIARYMLMYHRYAKMTSKYPARDNLTYHLVGKEDTNFLNRLNPQAKAIFIPHPHYAPTSLPHAEVTDGEKIRLLIAGAYNFTMAQAADEAFNAMGELTQDIKDRYHLTFLGKGWDKSAAQLRNIGFEVEQKGYVDDYAAEVSSHHIQLTPIAVGTGTKGKVLDAYVNGLMVIGTPLALENIDAVRGSECVEYTTGRELNEWLTRLAGQPEMINKIAKAGNEAVLQRHSREKIAKEFFDLF